MAYPRPLCENPQLIFNRKAVYNLLMSGEYYIAGKLFHVTPACREVWRQRFPYKKFAVMAHKFESIIHIDGQEKRIIYWDALETSFVGYDENNQKVYLFLAVPCGHCVLCTHKKQSDFIARCNMENQTSQTRPIMVTLTYDPRFLPFKKDVVCHHFDHRFDCCSNILRFDSSPRNHVSTYTIPLIARNVPYFKNYKTDKYEITDPSYYGFVPTLLKSDIQKFLKRLRIFWSRSGRSAGKPPLRYVCFGEYGHNYGRPHYHLILWNVPYNITQPTDFEELETLKRDILASWRMCVYDSCQVEIARHAAKYVSKYISKNMVDSHDNMGFRLASNRHGGIGALFIKTQIPFLRNNPCVQSVSYVDKWSGEFTQSTFGRYVHDKVFPSSSKLIPDKYKQTLRYDHYLLSVLGRLAHCFKQYSVSNLCEQLSVEDNYYPNLIHNEYTRFISVPKDWLSAPMFTDFIELYDTILDARQSAWDAIKDIEIPPESDLIRLSRLRYQHDNQFLRPEVTDDIIMRTKNAILEQREEDLARELF